MSEITIKALTPELIEDYFDFFDNRAFSDGSPYYPCYCNAFNLSLEQLQKDVLDREAEYGEVKEGVRLALRASAWKMVQEGLIQGYLAYDNDIAVGWCNANDRLSYFRVGEFDIDEAPVDSVPDDCPNKGFIKSLWKAILRKRQKTAAYRSQDRTNCMRVRDLRNMHAMEKR